MKEKCNQCTKPFKTGNCKIGCEYCGNWYHIACEGVSEDLWKVLSENDQTHWFCKKCNVKAKEVLEIVQKGVQETAELRKEVIDLTEKVNKALELTEKVKDIKEGKDLEFIDMVKTLVRQVKQEDRENNVNEENTTTNETIRQIARTEVHENNDKKGRECNVVIAGIDEEKDETEEVEEMLTYLNVTVEVDGIRRMGRDKKPGMNRQVWVRLGSKKERNTVIENAKKLKDEEKWRNVYINRDMTESERTEAYNLRKELRAKRAQEQQNGQQRSKFTIRRRQVIRVDAAEREGETVAEDGSPDTDAE